MCVCALPAVRRSFLTTAYSGYFVKMPKVVKKQSKVYNTTYYRNVKKHVQENQVKLLTYMKEVKQRPFLPLLSTEIPSNNKKSAIYSDLGGLSTDSGSCEVGNANLQLQCTNESDAGNILGTICTSSEHKSSNCVKYASIYQHRHILVHI